MGVRFEGEPLDTVDVLRPETRNPKPNTPQPPIPISGRVVQGHLIHKKQQTPRTLQQNYVSGPVVPLWGGADSYEPGTPAWAFVGPQP